MSMISGLIDELNKSADEWNASNMFELARMCREAADTIWELRDDLQRANAAVQDAEHDESRAWDRVRKAEAEADKLREEIEAAKHDLQVFSMGSVQLEAENAKLRELVRDMWNEGMCECGSRGKCARCEYGYPDRMRELGVEVDG